MTSTALVAAIVRDEAVCTVFQPIVDLLTGLFEHALTHGRATVLAATRSLLSRVQPTRDAS